MTPLMVVSLRLGKQTYLRELEYCQLHQWYTLNVKIKLFRLMYICLYHKHSLAVKRELLWIHVYSQRNRIVQN